jgi:hypothetical protein
LFDSCNIPLLIITTIIVYCLHKGAPNQGCSVEFVHFGGCIARNTGSCFGHCKSVLEMHSICVWDDVGGDAKCVEWSRHFGLHVAHAIGLADDAAGNINTLGPGQTGTKSTCLAYGDDVYRRLQLVKRDHDPANRFKGNHNIEPK